MQTATRKRVRVLTLIAVLLVVSISLFAYLMSHQTGLPTLVSSQSTTDLNADEISTISKSIVSLRCFEEVVTLGKNGIYYNPVIFGSGIYLNLSSLGSNINRNVILTNSHVAPVKVSDTQNRCLAFFLEDGQQFTRDAFHSSHFYYVDYQNRRSIKKDAEMLDIALLDEFTEATNYILTPERRSFLDANPLNRQVPRLKACGDRAVGSKVYIFGYPGSAMQGEDPSEVGYYDQKNNLIVSEGIISGKSPQGNYFTTAKIDAGNSGGAAISKDNGDICLIGVPTWVAEGDYENLGVIQPIGRILDVLKD